MRLYAKLYPRTYDPDEIIDLVGLSDKRVARLKTLSGGQRRRLDLALGLIGVPDLLFLDEPTTGFDPSARHRAWELIHRLREFGTTILLTTHYIEEAERLADRVAVIRAGRLVALGRPGELTDGRAAVSKLRFRLPVGVSLPELPVLTVPVSIVDGAVEARTASPTIDTYTLAGWALQHGLELPALTVTRPTLEDVYLRLVEEPSDER
jgi:ABC-type multidrug transport system ATPase subunit